MTDQIRKPTTSWRISRRDILRLAPIVGGIATVAGVVQQWLNHEASQPPAAGGGQPLYPGDHSKFIRDVSIPDGSRLHIKQRDTKIWEIQNVGTVAWRDRYLAREGQTKGTGRLHTPDRVRIPDTMPGGRCRISMPIQAPDQPGSCRTEFKMVDRDGRYLLPDQDPLYIEVDTVA